MVKVSPKVSPRIHQRVWECPGPRTSATADESINKQVSGSNFLRIFEITLVTYAC